jgi:hypothetical protein
MLESPHGTRFVVVLNACGPGRGKKRSAVRASSDRSRQMVLAGSPARAHMSSSRPPNVHILRFFWLRHCSHRRTQSNSPLEMQPATPNSVACPLSTPPPAPRIVARSSPLRRRVSHHSDWSPCQRRHTVHSRCRFEEPCETRRRHGARATLSAACGRLSS